VIRIQKLVLVLALLVLPGACKAGPSVFDRKGGAATTQSQTRDTAHAVSTRRAPAARGSHPADPRAVAKAPVAAPAADAPPRTSGRPAAKAVDSVSGPSARPAVDAVGVVAASGTSDGVADAGVAVEPRPPAEVPHFERPEHVRGLYLNAWAAGSARRIEDLTALARRTEINSFVVDIKDASGYVSHRTAVPLANKIGATGEIRIRDLPGLLRRLKAEGIYPIARIVIVKDPILTAARPDLAVQDTAGGPFRDEKGIVWVNPYNHEVWDYEVALAREVARMGFPEIQWDYIRFPDIPGAEKGRVVYPGANGRTQPEAIADFMAYSRKQLGDLGVRVTADVFGVTTSATRDVGIGQVWERFIGSIDVALPMVYPSHYWKGSFGYQTPNAYPYEVVRRALRDALRRSADVPDAGAVRPWLQDFSLGKPPYGAPEVRAEIQAVYDAGIQEWILWNPGSHYTEAALEPEGGFREEPTIRVATRIVPVSKRWEVLDSVARPVGAASDSAAARRGVAVPDTAKALDRTPTPDTTTARDTLGAGSGRS
jgi:hypothetical protein